MRSEIIKGVLFIECESLESFRLEQIKNLFIKNNIKYNKTKYFKCIFNNNVATIMLSNDLRVNNILIVQNLVYIIKDLLLIYKDTICFESQLKKIYNQSIEVV